MNKFYETLTNLRGDVLFGYRAQVVDETGASVDIYRDRSGTRFTDGSGNIVNYAEASSDTGMAEFYWTAETGHILQITDSSGELARPPIIGFGDNYVLGNLSGDLPTTAIDGLDATLAAKADTTYVDTGLAGKVPTADLASTDTGKGAALVAFKQTGTGTIARTIGDKLEEFVSVKDYGAVGDGVADDSSAVQKAFDDRNSIYFPAGTYRIKGVALDGPVNEQGVVRRIWTSGQTILVNDFADGSNMFTVSANTATNFLHFSAASIQSEVGSGHVFDIQGNCNHCIFDVLFVEQSETGKSIFSCLDKSFFFNTVRGVYWSITSSHTVPALLFTSTSNRISANVFDIVRPNFSGSRHFMELTSTSGTDFNYANKIFLQFPEKTAGGVIRTARDANTEFQAHLFDTTMTVSPTVNHMVEFGQTGYISLKPRVRSYMRNSGTLGSGLVDIMLTDTNGAIIEAASGVSNGSKIAIDLNNEPNSSVLHALFCDITNAPANATILRAGEGITTPSMSYPIQVTALTIATGEITVTDSVHYVDTEAAAVSDDLVTINGGTDGQMLMLRSVSNARDIVLKDTGGNLSLAGDFTLSRVEDMILLRYDSAIAGWVEISRSDNAA